MKIFQVIFLMILSYSCGNRKNTFYPYTDTIEMSNAIEIKKESTSEIDHNQYRFHGIVRNKTTGIEELGVVFKIIKDDGSITGVISDEDGLFSTYLFSGEYTIEVMYTGYVTEKIEVSAKSGISEKYTVYLD